MSDLDEIRGEFDKFVARRRLQQPAEDTKMAVVGILLLSVFVFSMIGKQVVRQIIWYWVAFMVLMLIGCAIQDYIISRKIKKLSTPQQSTSPDGSAK